MATQTFASRAKRITNKYKRRLGDNFNKYDPIAQESMNLELENLKQEQEQVRAEMGLDEYSQEYANGGNINIKPENKGKFTATKKRTGKTTEELTHSKNSLTRKRAIFAQNAKKWKHENGGNLPKALNGIDINSLNKIINYYNDPSVANLVNTGENLTIPQDFNNTNNNAVIDNTDKNLPNDTIDYQLYEPNYNWVGAGATFASGIYNYLNSPDSIDKIKYTDVKPELVDLSSERIAANARSNQLRNSSRRAARSISGGRADYTNRVVSSDIATNRLEGEQIARSLSSEKLSNAQIINSIRQFNARNKLMTDAQNVQIDELNKSYDQNKNQAIIDIATGLSQSYADWQKQKDLYNALNVQSPYYSIYKDPETVKPIILYDKNKNG